MKVLPIVLKAKVWIWKGNTGPASWHFITIPLDESDIIKDQYIWPRKGFGSIPVQVKIGETEWKTSVFPQKEGTYILPIKKSVRDTEQIKAGDDVKLIIEVNN